MSLSMGAECTPTGWKIAFSVAASISAYAAILINHCRIMLCLKRFDRLVWQVELCASNPLNGLL